MELIEQLKNLIMMAAADGQFAEQELSFLADRCHHYGLTDDQFQSAFKEATKADAKLVIPTDHSEKMKLMRDMLRMMAADGKLNEMEKRLFASAAVQMQIDRVEIDELIDQLLVVKKSGKTPDLL